MSLINDALKRAQEAQRPNTPSSVSSLRSIETQPTERPFVSRMLVIGIFLLLAAAVAFMGLTMTARLAKKNIVPPQAAPAQPVPAAVAAVPPVPTAPAVVIAAPVAPVPPAPVVVAAAPPPPPPPLVLPDTLHVQGIVFDSVRPWAIVSGKTVYVGSLVKGLRVLEISRNSVTFGSNGQSNLLFVGQ